MYEIYCRLRDERNLRDADVVKGTGITKSTFTEWKNGRSKPKPDKLIKIANFFGVSVDYLMGIGKTTAPIEPADEQLIRTQNIKSGSICKYAL